MKIFNFDGPFSRVMGRIFDLVLLHLLWVVTSLPIVTIGASTTALFTVTLKMTRNEESYIVKSYFKAFRENFKQATQLWLVVAFAGAYLLFMMRICMKVDLPVMKLAGLLNGALLVMFFLGVLYVFPIQAKFENSLVHTLKNSWLCSLQFLPYSIGMAAVVVVPILVTGFVSEIFPMMIALWVFGGSALLAFGISWFARKVFDQLIRETV